MHEFSASELRTVLEARAARASKVARAGVPIGAEQFGQQRTAAPAEKED
jgi:hypothetical protein